MAFSGNKQHCNYWILVMILQLCCASHIADTLMKHFEFLNDHKLKDPPMKNAS